MRDSSLQRHHATAFTNTPPTHCRTIGPITFHHEFAIILSGYATESFLARYVPGKAGLVAKLYRVRCHFRVEDSWPNLDP